MLFNFLPVGSRACCYCRATNHKGKGPGSTKPSLPSFPSGFSTPELPWRGGRWGSRCCRANTPTLIRCSPARPLLSAHLLSPPPHSPPAVPVNPLCPSVDPREQNLLVQGKAMTPDLHKVGCDHPELFLLKTHTSEQSSVYKSQ